MKILEFFQFPSSWCKTKTDAFTKKGGFLTVLQQHDEKDLFLIELGQRTLLTLVLKGLTLAINILSVALMEFLRSM